MGELISTSSDLESGFEEPEPPLSKTATILNKTWDQYWSSQGDRTAIIEDLHAYTTYLLREFIESGANEADLLEHVQIALMCARQPILPKQSPGESGIDRAPSQSARRTRRLSRLGTDVTHRFAWLRNSR
jgi:hypothetical protein